MNYFVFTSGAYSNYGIHEIYSREQPPSEEEIDEMLRVVATKVRANEAARKAAWVSYIVAHEIPESPNGFDKVERALYNRAYNEFYETGWPATHPEGNELAEELDRCGFTLVPFNEIHLYDYDWDEIVGGV